MNQKDTTVNDGFAFELRSVLLMHAFNVEEALKLSDRIHEFECGGGELSKSVESMWERLTFKIEATKTSSV